MEENETISCNFKCDQDDEIEHDRLLANNIIFVSILNAALVFVRVESL